MSGARRLYLDDAPGELRGVVTLDGQPERLLIERAGHPPVHQPGARLVARVRRIERPLATLFLDVGLEPDAVMPLTGAAKTLNEGARVEVEVLVAPRIGKGAVVRLIGLAMGEPRVLAVAPALVNRLAAFAPGVEVIRGQDAREAADAAEDAALAVVHSLPAGGSIAIEPTRALVAIDVDVGQGAGDARKAATRANREAIAAAARLLRLKGLGGPIAFDLAGKGHDGEALKQAAEAAFAPDQPGVGFGPITRFGLWTLNLPRSGAPVAEILCSPDGGLSNETLALRLLRAIERAAGAGARIEAHAAPEVALVVQPLAPHLSGRIGARFRIVADAEVPRDRPRIGPWETTP